MSHPLRLFMEQRVPLADEVWDDFERSLGYLQLKKKDHFLREGQVCRQVAFITRGYVRLYYLHNGEEITKDFNFENFFCGSWASFSMQQPSRFNIIVMEDVELYTIGRDDLYRLFNQYPAFQEMGRMWMEMMFIRKEMREASFLLDTAEQRYADLLSQNDQIIQRVPLKYLASYLGMTAETLSRIRSQGVKKKK
ncbi:MAG TPA: Crp/Fnr family transcriptional regulator [Chitinophagaceae bacterium]|nr:Crp/Fnr family transcriptional regulator [Chitinophagaceae bacterium]